MKKIILTFSVWLIAAMAWAQIVKTNPTFVTQSSGVIEVTYDASLGTAGLKDYTGTDGIYAHTGLITSESTSNKDWKYAPEWGDNSEKYKLTSLGNNKWKFTITPSIVEFYAVATGEDVQKIAFVFRNGLKTKEGKETGGVDIYIDVYQAGLNVAFTKPTENMAVVLGSSHNIEIASSLAATELSLFANGSLLKKANGASTLSHTYTFSTADDYTFIAEAKLGGSMVRDTLLICAPAAVTNQTRPAGVKNGINYIDDNTVTLVLHAPSKNNVFLIGEFNDWTQLNAFQLKKDGEYWWITLNDLVAGKIYKFQYLVDGTTRISDPFTELVVDPWNDKWINENHDIYPNLLVYPEGKTEGLVATFQTAKTPYNWEVPNFNMPSRENMVIYELLLRDFTVEKSLEAAIEKLDYLKDLGITAIELMPTQEFDGNNSWGYNPNHFFAMDKAYGTTETYKRFIDECHKRGMAVILDVVFNHATGQFPYAKLWWNDAANKTSADNPYFNVDAPHPYSVFHDFNHEYQPTKDYFKEVIQYLITEFKLDGFRLDLTKGFTQKNTTESNAAAYDQSRIDILSDYYNSAKAKKSDIMFILEHFCDNAEESALAGKGMYLWRNINNSFSQAAMGYQSDSDFGGMNSTPRHWVGYAESHDEERNFYKAKAFGSGNLKTDSIARINRVPLNIAFATLIPGPKMLWQFGEIGFDYSINSQGGRTSEKPSAWSYLELAHRKAAYEASSKVINLRRLYPNAFTQGEFSLQVSAADWGAGRRIALKHSDLNLVVLGNFKVDAAINANPGFSKTGIWYEALTGEQLNVSNTSMNISLQPGELKVYTDRKVDFPNSVDSVIESSSNSIFPAVTDGVVYIKSNDRIQQVTVYNLQGSLILTKELNNQSVDLSTLESGLYLMKLNSASKETVHKLIRK